ncbi:MAG: hypothetical protein QXX12_04050 [Nanopusillaceae archaeon]
MGLENILLILLSALISTLEEDSDRVKVGRVVFLIGLSFVLSDLISMAAIKHNPYVTTLILVITALLLFYAGVHALSKFNEFINELLLKTTICINTGEDCEELVDKHDDVFKVVFNKLFELLRGEWFPLEEMLRRIISHKPSKRQLVSLIFKLLYISMYHVLTSISLLLLFTALLMALGVPEYARLAVKTPLYVVGTIFTMFGFTLSYSTGLILESGEVKKERSYREAILLIPAEVLYRRILTISPRSRFERIALKLTSHIFNAFPKYPKPRQETPLLILNLYECSPVISTIIDEVEKLSQRGFKVQIEGNKNWIGKDCKNTDGLARYIELHDKITPLDIYKELMLFGKEDEKIEDKKEEKIKHGVRIIVREMERTVDRSNASSEVERASISGNTESKPSRVVAVIGIRVWKGCVKRYRIRSEVDKGHRRERRKPKPIIKMEFRRVFSISIVGRRDVAGIVNILLTAHLRQASEENILCVEEEETQQKAAS